jgi:hypothetical protein
MSIFRGIRLALISFGILCLVITAALVIAPSFIVRYLLIDYLHEAGVTADIGHVDADIFTGTVVTDNAHGKTGAGEVFDIGHAALDLRYAPLLHKHISLSRLTLADARLDVRRSADNTLKVGGITVISAKPRQSAPLQWGLGLKHLAIDRVVIHYRQAAQSSQPAISRMLKIHSARIRHVATWQPDANVPFNAHLSVGDSQLRLSGHARPFGATQTARFKLATKDFALSLLAPFTHVGGLNKLAGTLNGQQQIDVEYDPHEALTTTVDGTAHWTGAALASHSGSRIASRAIDWQGKLKATLFRANGQPGRLDTTSTLDAQGVNITQPNTLTLKQTAIHWKGSATATLAGASTTASTRGLLATTGTHLEAPGRLDFSTAHDSLQGLIQIGLTAKATHIKTNGTFKARHLAFSVPKRMAFSGDRVTYHGAADTALENKQTQIDTHGKMGLDGLSFAVPGTGRMSARHVDWNGHTKIRSAKLFGRRAAGRLAATGIKLYLTGRPLAVSADRFAFKGEYGKQPDAGGHALKLTVNGDFNSHKLAITDTHIHAPWFTALQTHGAKLAVNGLDSITLSALECSGIRIFGDTDTDSSVIQAVGLTARQFQFQNLAHYHVASLGVSSAIIHTRRDPGGLGVLSEFFPGSKSKQTAGANSHSTGSTYAIDHLHLSGPALTFVDTAVTPAVRIRGSNLDFTLNNVDTAKPGHNASYRLAMDIGAYGHLDSRGTIAPMAPGGVDLTLSAYLRSLAMAPFSGYLNAAMGRGIASGAADGTLRMTSQRGQLGGQISTTLGNFRLANGSDTQTDVALGLSLDTALALVRGRNDQLDFKTSISGDLADPGFSIRHLIREAVLSGIRTALLSNYSPLGLLNRAKNAISDLGHSLGSRPAVFVVGKHSIRAEDRDYLGRLAHSLLGNPRLILTIQSHAVPGDADALSPWQRAAAGRDNNRTPLERLAQRRAQAVRDYLSARKVSPNRIKIAAPTINSDNHTNP